jgi:hypothetical protein
MPREMTSQKINLECKKAELGCDEKNHKLDEGECGQGDLMEKFAQAGCDETDTSGTDWEKCCPMFSEIVSCRNPECLKLNMATEKQNQDHDYAGDSPYTKKVMKKEMEKMELMMKSAKECKVTGVPVTKNEVQATLDPASPSRLPTTTTSPSASPATGFDAQGVFELATAATVFALVA